MGGVLGIHHVTAIASEPQRNLDFYVGVLGLRLVKRTVNFDDPRSYHFYFGDDIGRPGSLLTFFPWQGAARGRQGTGQAAVLSFAILPSAMGFWIERFVHYGVAFEAPAARWPDEEQPEQALAFKDHDGLMLELVAHPGAEARSAWGSAPGIPMAFALHGLHAVTLWENQREETERLLLDTLGFRLLHEQGVTRRYAVGAGGPGRLVDVRTVGGFVRGAGGAGTVHHVAWRVGDDPSQLALRAQLAAEGLGPTPVIDRQYFHSVYFREPGGVLFEIATDAPGFAVDEPVDHLGERLMLPPQFEADRSTLELALPPVHLPEPVSQAALMDRQEEPVDASGDALGFVHRYLPPAAGAGRVGRITLLLLHGTGGDEDDLIALGRELLPGAGLLSPRGKSLEQGMHRFFRRFAEGVFDQEDLERRTHELAAFIEGAAAQYAREPGGIVAVGFSNGANIAASLLLRRPGLLRTAVLLSPMVPFEPYAMPDLARTWVFIGAGREDPIAPPVHAERLAQILEQAGADVTLHVSPGGHGLDPSEVEAARRWITRSLTAQGLLTGPGPGDR